MTSTFILQDKDPIGIIPLENLCVRKVQDSSKLVESLILKSSYPTLDDTTIKRTFLPQMFEQFSLEIYNPRGQKIKACKTENKGKVVQGKHQSYKLRAASEEERDDWMDAIR